MGGTVEKRRADDVTIAVMGSEIEHMKDTITSLGDDMSEVRKDVSEMKVGHGKVETKLDILIETVGESIKENKKEHLKNYRTRLILKWVLGLPAVGAGILSMLKVLLTKASWVKLTAFLSL